MIVVPRAFTNGVEVVKPIALSHAKDHSDVDQMLTRNQIMEYASKDNYDLCVDSAHIDSLIPLLQGMPYVNHNPGVCLLMINVLPGDGFTNGKHNLPCCDIHSWWPDELCNLGNQYSKVPSCPLSHESNCLAIWCSQTLSCELPCLSARVVSFKLPGVSMSHWTSDLVTPCSWFSR